MKIFRQKYAFLWTAFSMGGKAMVAFLQLILLSRLLSVEQLSLVALVLTVTSICQMISDLGVSSAIIHFDNISDNELSSLYWLNVLFSCAIALLLFFIADPISKFYATGSLAPLIQLSALYFVFWSIGQQKRVLAEKALEFGPLALIEVGSFAIGFLVTLSFVHADFGAASVAIGFVTNGAINSIMSVIFLRTTARLTFRLKISEFRRYLKYGLKVIFANICNTLTLQSDVIIAGRLISVNSLAIYTQPRELCLRIMFVINPVITRVTFPLMASVKGNAANIKKIYLKSIGITASLNFPIYLFLSGFSNEIVRLVFGEKWLHSGPLMAWLGLWCAVRSLGNPVGSLLFATGRATLAAVNSFCVMIALFAMCALGAAWGYHGLIWSLIAAYLVMIPVFWFTLIRPACGAEFIEYVSHFVRPALISVVSAGLARSVATLISGEGLLSLVIGLSVMGITYPVLTYLFNRTAYIDAVEIVTLGKS